MCLIVLADLLSIFDTASVNRSNLLKDLSASVTVPGNSTKFLSNRWLLYRLFLIFLCVSEHPIYAWIMYRILKTPSAYFGWLSTITTKQIYRKLLKKNHPCNGCPSVSAKIILWEIASRHFDVINTQAVIKYTFLFFFSNKNLTKAIRFTNTRKSPIILRPTQTGSVNVFVFLYFLIKKKMHV